MAIPITRAEYEKKFGKPPVAATSTAPIKITRAEYEAKFGKPAQAQSPTANIPVIKQLSAAGVGIGSQIGKAGLGLGQAALKGVGALGNVLSPGTAARYTEPLVRNIEGIKQKVYTDPFKQQLESTSGKIGTGVGAIIPYVAPTGAITKAQAGITGAISKIPVAGNLAKFGKGALGVAARAVPEAIGAGAVGLAVSGGDTERAKRDALLGGAFSAGLGTVGAVGRGVKDSGLAQKVLSKTTGISNPTFEAVKKTGIIKEATPERALQKGREAVVGLRTKNTKMWQESLPKIADEYEGLRMGLTENQMKNFAKVADEFGINEDLLPQNLKNMSAIESMNLMKALNEIDGLAATVSPRGALIRSLKKELRPEIIRSFGGEKGKVAELWKNYATKQTILDNMDSIVKAYKTNPTQTVTAKNRLMAIFDENKPEFLKAVKEIEKEMGIDITSEVASTKFQTLLPKGILKADGGLPTKAGIVDKLVSALLIPFTSPRLAGKLALPSKGTVGEIEARVFGDYGNTSKRSTTPITSQESSMTTPIAPSINNNIDSIPATLQSSANKSSLPVDKPKFDPTKQGGFVSIGKRTVKEIPETTKAELYNAIKFLKGEKSPITESDWTKLAKKFEINENQPLASVVKRIETILDKTKTKTVLPKPNKQGGYIALPSAKEAKKFVSGVTPAKVVTVAAGLGAGNRVLSDQMERTEKKAFEKGTANMPVQAPKMPVTKSNAPLQAFVPKRYVPAVQEAVQGTRIKPAELAALVNSENGWWDETLVNATGTDTGLGQHNAATYEDINRLYKKKYGKSYNRKNGEENLKATALWLDHLMDREGINSLEDAVKAYRIGVAGLMAVRQGKGTGAFTEAQLRSMANDKLKSFKEFLNS